jgi:hypothetical protein
MDYRHGQLALKLQSAYLQFGAKQQLVGGLEETGPKGPVKLTSTIDRSSRKLLQPLGVESLWLRGFVRL